MPEYQNQEKISPDRLLTEIGGNRNLLECSGLQGPESAWLLSRIYEQHKIPLTVILPTHNAARKFAEDLCFFLPPEDNPVQYFPAYNIQPFKLFAYHNQTAAERVRVLYRMVTETRPLITVTTSETVRRKIIPRQILTDYAEILITGEEADRDRLIEKLISGSYVRTAVVEEPGDFCVRGGIIDVFSPLYPEPVRIEMFGDLVESIRFFSAATQRTLEMASEVVLLPARETVLKPSDLPRLMAQVREQADRCNLAAAQVQELSDRIRSEGIFAGIESLLPLIYPEPGAFTDYVPENGLVVLMDPDSLRKSAEEAEKQGQENYQAAFASGKLCLSPNQVYHSWPKLRQRLEERKCLNIHLFHPVSETAENYRFTVSDNSMMQPLLKQGRESSEPFLPLVEWLREKQGLDCAVVLACDTRARAERILNLLSPYDLRIHASEALPDIYRSRGMIRMCPGKLSAGFVWPEAGLALLTDTEIFGTRRQRKRQKPRSGVRTELLTFEDLRQGDMVVHAEHGIGRYEGLAKLKLEGMTNDYLLIVYRDEDKLYLPVERMGMIQKYMGVDGIQPVVDKLGGATWDKVRAKVRKSVEKIAGELLRIYAERRIGNGFAFRAETMDFQEFIAGFPYEETPDQLKAIEDVLADMEADAPMDRLICGDVGYGKTEVALRASFMAVAGGKQVGVLVPTTVLAEQHFETFSKRYENFPVRVACLSRFRSAKEQRGIIENLNKGTVDIVIGTHRLLQKDVLFKDIGLIIIDEEQRFGVRHKEKLKSLRTTIDVLALTATPIPRTLHMSLMGIRDISVISTPPEQRQAVMTYISEFNEGIVADAVRKELRRGGQIFFVHNHIQTIDKTADYLQKLVPEVRLAVAHGSMSEAELEKVMIAFINREVDMLVCTTIIESGLDVPAANTILINRAERFGLSQIYQLRGRVGRADEQAYAYLFVSSEDALTRDARKRLKVLMEHSDLGSGFQIAMSDLKIRGGGSILGASQSGHIAAVGYDMFLKLMEEAVADLKGEPMPEPLEPEINIPLSAFIAEEYIPDIDQRLTSYRRLSRMTGLKEISDFKEELIDRFGPLPEEAGNLLLKIMLKILSVKAGVRRLDLAAELLVLHFSQLHQKNPFGIVDLVTAEKGRFVLTPDRQLRAKIVPKGNPLVQVKNILREISRSVNG